MTWNQALAWIVIWKPQKILPSWIVTEIFLNPHMKQSQRMGKRKMLCQIWLAISFGRKPMKWKSKRILAGNLLSRAKGPAKETSSPRENRMRLKLTIWEGSIYPRVKVWEGEAKPQNLLQRFYAKVQGNGGGIPGPLHLDDQE